jgi:hypothetical protein
MKVLHLTLKKKWFDMIASGEKKEEYREIKSYWISRLCCGFPSMYSEKTFDVVLFRNGYSKDSPKLAMKWIGMQFGDGKPEWGAEPGKKYFVIKLGEKLF